MNELLQKHGCANVFTIPEGLKELMSDITREVLRDQPPKIFDYIANYLSILLITREHGILAVKILDDLCDCRPSVSEHLLQLGVEKKQADMLSHVIKEEVEGLETVEGKEKVKETQILKKILARVPLDEEMTARVCQVARNAYRDYWYKKKLMEKNIKMHPDEPWEMAAERTLNLYKRTKPSLSELTRATQKIQAAYRGYYYRRNILRHLKPKVKKSGPKVELPGAPIDIASSREIDLGPVIDIQVREDDIGGMFDEAVGEKLGLQYNPMRTITHVEDQDEPEPEASGSTKFQSGLSTKSLASRSQFGKSGQSQMTMEARKSRAASIIPDAESRKSIIRDAVSGKSIITGAESRKSMIPDAVLRKSMIPDAEPRTFDTESCKSMIPNAVSRKSMIPDTESRKSMISDAVSRKSMIPDTEARVRDAEPRKSMIPDAVSRKSMISDPEARKSRPGSIMPDIPGRKSRAVSVVDDTSKITFAEDLTEVIEEPEAIPEEIADTAEVKASATGQTEDAQEVPEDIADDRTESEGESAPTGSIPSSGSNSATATDVEDTGESAAEDEA